MATPEGGCQPLVRRGSRRSVRSMRVDTEGTGLPRQQPDLVSQPISGWTEGVWGLSGALQGAGTFATVLLRTVPGPRRRRVAGPGVRAGRGSLPGPVLRGRLRPHHPWPARHPGLAARACVRVGFYFVHIWWMRAVGADAWVALASVESIFWPPGVRHRRPRSPAALAALGGRGLGHDGGGAQLLAVQRDAVGQARVRHGGHPHRGCVGVRRVGRRQLPARAPRLPLAALVPAGGGGWRRSHSWGSRPSRWFLRWRRTSRRPTPT